MVAFLLPAFSHDHICFVDALDNGNRDIVFGSNRRESSSEISYLIHLEFTIPKKLLVRYYYNGPTHKWIESYQYLSAFLERCCGMKPLLAVKYRQQFFNHVKCFEE